VSWFGKVLWSVVGRCFICDFYGARGKWRRDPSRVTERRRVSGRARPVFIKHCWLC
jgi:hypothetical protein